MNNKEIREKLENFFSQFKSIKYKKGETILRAEDVPQGASQILSGYVKMNSLLADGRELTLNIFKPGSFFPMMWAISNMENSYFFYAMTDVELRRAPKDSLVDFIKKNPDVLFDLTNRILIGLNGLITNFEHIISDNAYSRVISALFILAKRFGEKTGKNNIVIGLPLTHSDIANIAAITRETASIAIKKIERKKIISKQGRLFRIDSMEKLKEEFLMNNKAEDDSPSMV